MHKRINTNMKGIRKIKACEKLLFFFKVMKKVDRECFTLVDWKIQSLNFWLPMTSLNSSHFKKAFYQLQIHKTIVWNFQARTEIWVDGLDSIAILLFVFLYLIWQIRYYCETTRLFKMQNAGQKLVNAKQQICCRKNWE